MNYARFEKISTKLHPVTDDQTGFKITQLLTALYKTSVLRHSPNSQHMDTT